MKKYIFLIIGLFLTSIIFTKGIILDNLFKPYSLNINRENIYVLDESSFSFKIYSISKYKYQNEFGKRGEGPGEFIGMPMISILQDSIFLCSPLNAFWYTKDGKLIKQIKKPPYVYMKPLNNGFIGETIFYDQEQFKSFNLVSLYDHKFKKTKDIYKQFKRKIIRESKNIKQDMVMIDPSFEVRTHQDQIFIADCRKEFYIGVFDSNGNLLYPIKKKPPGVKITREYKDKVMERYKTSKLWLENKRNFNYLFPPFFPPIKTFEVSDDKIYIITFKKKDQLNELIILSLEGKFLKETCIPFSSRIYCFKNNKYYYLEDKDEEWNLQVISLD